MKKTRSDKFLKSVLTIFNPPYFRVTVGTPFYSLQSRDLDTFWALDTSGANDQLLNLIYNGITFQKNN